MDRRQFVQSVMGAGVLASGWCSETESAEPAYPFSRLEDALSSAGFKPRDPDSFTVVWAADVHYGIGQPDGILPPVIREVHAMEPRPAFFGIAGDLIVKASKSFGQVPDAAQKKEAIAEFQALKEHLAKFDPKIPIKLALGNHDTYPGERNCELFHTVFPEHPEYHACTIKGVPFLFLNGGSSGFIEETQREWFRAQVGKLHQPGRTLMLVVHQPALGSVVAERGIPAAFRDVLADCAGDLWMISGHIHRNQDSCFQLPKAVITQAVITAGNPAVWGTDHPAYWIYGFHKGKLAVRVCRRIGQGYAVAPPPPKDQPSPIRLPFEGRDDLLWKVLVGEGDKPYLVDAKAAWCLNYWFYNEHLIYKFPLSLAAGKAKRFGLLEIASGKKPRKYAASPDGNTWTDIAAVDRDGSYTSFPIPRNCLEAGALHVRLEQCAVSGFALTK